MRTYARSALASLLAMLVLALKALPLACFLSGVARKNVYTMQWASMLVLLYFAEGVVRGMMDSALSALLAWLEALLALAFFVCALAYVAPFKRASRLNARAKKPDAFAFLTLFARSLDAL